MKKILVTGSAGQLGSELQELAPLYTNRFTFLFTDRAVFPLDDAAKMQAFFAIHQPDYCINCAAYTAVDKAEADPETALQINGWAVGVLAALCQEYGTRLIHISTDYVFDGTSAVALEEDALVNPVNEYGRSKLKGEELALKECASSIIIRTSWVYSSYGNNFVKTMMRLMQQRTEINVVNDQIGAPTYAADLASAIVQIIDQLETGKNSSHQAGIYHYCNEGRISWYDFALAIRDKIGSTCAVLPIPSSSYPTPAKRPAFSLMATDKIQRAFKVPIFPWKESLDSCLLKLQHFLT
ncbi:dTDP-4-dehydrorhamnose reductase [Flavihumibacter sp. CACIAM 22H1]|uniref:dTDP-4-dehydrorhamnose reductase n=1 Tax=Flavihumibacter sp. CACIAM 22H1 TaxID=1812911 RepID=UPI0007A81CF3|nr:dTDP-4-dehydrorhamnose reductase [Flavihumibacter sp. CACIAM 22H1]KYP14288.1 MAG: NAD(P)-dependent oxidoreductase [Flavihumibacter sp. CACIAM 22H1]